MDKVWQIAKQMQYQSGPVEGSAVSLLLKITSQCRSRCQYCLSWQTKPDKLPINAVEKIAIDIKRFSAKRVVLSGGEPTTHPEFKNIVKLFKDADIHLSVITDGLFSPNAEWTDNINEIIFSLDTHEAEVYKTIRGVNGYSRAFANLSRTAKKGISTSVNIVLTRPAIYSLEKTIDQLANEGVNKIYFLELETHLEIPKELCPSSEEIFWFQSQLFPSLRRTYHQIIPNTCILSNPIHRSISTPCIIPWMHLTIRPNGNIYPCCRLGDDTPNEVDSNLFCLGNTFKDSLCDIWLSERRKRVQEKIHTFPPSACLQCNIGAFFQGGNSIWDQIELVRM